MSDVQYAVRQDGMFVAKVIVPYAGAEGEAAAMREALHYLAVYRQDGPADLWRRSSNRHWRCIDDGAHRRAVVQP